MASIAEINGLTIPSSGGGFTGLLDETYGSGAAAAYSTRRLASATTVLLRVRRVTGTGNTGNDDEANFKFDTATDDLTLSSPIDDAGSSSATNLGQFLNATGYNDSDNLINIADGFVDTWTDQSGNSNNAEQTSPGSQPQIFDSSSPTDLIKQNGKAALSFNGSYLDHSSNLTLTASSFYSVVTASAATRVWYGIVDHTYLATFNTRITILAYNKSTSYNHVPSGQSLYSITRDGVGLAKIGLNGTQQSVSGNMTNQPGTWNSIGGFSPYRWQNNYQELIVYGSDEDSNTSDIETNINTHFSIY